MATFFTSDIHFGDKRIMKLCDRPFSSTQEMDEYIVNRWNNKVSTADTVWILGDSVSPEYFNKEILNSLNGKINLLLGNHDFAAYKQIVNGTKINVFDERLLYFDSTICPCMKISSHNVVMCHYPIMEWNGIEQGWILLYGHVHNKNLPKVKEYYEDKLALNVCMDVNDFEPKTLKELVIREGKMDLYRSFHGEVVKGFDF